MASKNKGGKRQIDDLDVRSLAGLAGDLHAEYEEDSAEWESSPFAWIKTRPSRQVGAIGEKLVAGWLEMHGFMVEPAGDSEADRVVNGHRVEIKFSTLWKQGGYKFQQIRNQRYDWLICLGVSPFDAHAWVLSKSFLLKGWGNLEGFKAQHGGQEGRDTAWIHVQPDAPHDWLNGKGGSLQVAMKALKRELKRPRGK